MADSVRVNISFPRDVLGRIDAYCKKTGIPRSAFVQLASTQYLDAVDAMPSVNTMLNAMASVVDGTFRGELSPDMAKEQIAGIKRTYTALTGRKIEE